MASKRKKMKPVGDEEDRLSNLPDSILHHILSYIDTKYAVRTSILSKRWTHLWTGVPSLNFNYKRFNRADQYRNFVTKVLFLRDDFTIRCCNLVNRHITCDTRLLERVIEYAEAHKVEQLNFTVEACAVNALPSNLFTCPSLTYLKLHQYNSGMDLPKLSGLGSLVTLCLEAFRISNDKIEILSTCTKLKNLSLISCFVVDENLNLGIPNLANLTISRIQSLKHSLLLSTPPNLVSFSFEGGKPLEFINELSCLENLSVNFYASKKEEDYLGFINMLKKLCNAESVTLSSDSIEVLRSCPNLRYQKSPFKKLKVLKVKKSDKRTPSINAPLHVLNYLSEESPCAVLQI